MVRHAFYFFHYYKGLYANRIFNIKEKRKSREYILHRTAEETFLLLEIELNFAYEAFYTKATIVYRKLGMVFRPIALLLEVVCLVIWCFTEKHGLQNNDIIITYTLLIGAIVIDVIALCRVLLSDWNIACLPKGSKTRSLIYNRLLSARSTRTWGRYKSKEEAPLLSACLRRAFFRRWSETVPQCNMLDFCLEKRGGKTKKVIEYLELKDMLDKYNYVTSKWFSDDLRDMIFELLQPTSCLGSEFAIKEIYSSMNWLDWFKKYVEVRKYDGYPLELYNLRFEISLLTHHVTTEYHYQLELEVVQTEDKKRNIFERTFGCAKDSSKVRLRDNNVYREFSKTVSDYMVYLLIWQPDVMPISAGLSKKMFNVTRDAVRTRIESEEPDVLNEKDKARRKQKASAHLLSPDAEKNLEMERKWEMFAEVWLLHLCYVTTHAKPNFHATQLKQGGELLSFVWLLVVHLGLKKELQFYFDDTDHSMVFIP